MIRKSFRLPREEYASGWHTRASTPYFSLKSKKNSSGRARVGVVAGISVHKTAAKRNFWKRQARVGLAKLGRADTDTLIILSPGVTKLTKKKFQEELAAAAKKLR